MSHVGTWLKHVQKDALVNAALATSIISAVGLSFMMWPIAAELPLALRDTMRGGRGGKA